MNTIQLLSLTTKEKSSKKKGQAIANAFKRRHGNKTKAQFLEWLNR